jgi:hypothetical protein
MGRAISEGQRQEGAAWLLTAQALNYYKVTVN